MQIKTIPEIALEREILNNLQVLVNVLTTASENRLMSPDHAKSIWKEQLRLSSYDVPKTKGGDEQ